MSQQQLAIIDAVWKLLLLPLAAYLWKLVQNHLNDSNAPQVVKSAVGTITDVARLCVNHAYQTTVRDLKDPSKPGSWDQKAKQAIKSSVTADVQALTSGAVKSLLGNGHSQEDAAKIIDRAIESAVAEMNARASSDVSMPMLSDPPASEMIPPPVPASPKPDDAPKAEAPKPIEPKL